jgi:hypothetical protein
MKIKSSIELAVLAMAVSTASSAVFYGELNSLKTEVVSNDYDGGYQKTEYTVAIGSYQLSDKWSFLFDIDRDYIDAPSADKKQGWDTQVGLSQSLSQLGGFDFSMYYLARYDATWNNEDGSDESYYTQYIISPFFSKDVTVAGKDMSLGIELWAQVGAVQGEDLQDISGAEANFYLDSSLSDNWSLNLAWYNFNYYDSSEDEYDYQIGTENYLTYSLDLNSNVTFSVENYFEAYYTFDNEEILFYGHVAPMIEYSKEVGDFNYFASVSYEVLNGEYEDGEDYSSEVSTTHDRELEFSIGVSF